MHLSPIGRDYSHVDALVENALLTYLIEIFLQRVERIFSLTFIHPTKRSAHKLLLKVVAIGIIRQAFGVAPLYRNVVIQNAASPHLRRGYHLSAIEPVA